MRSLLPKAIVGLGFLAITLANTGLAPRSATTGWDVSGDDYRYHVEASESAPDGSLVTLTVDQNVRHRGDKFYALTESVRYTLGREMLYNYNTTYSLDQGTSVVIAWGPAIRGAFNASFSIDQKGTVAGTVDGRAFSLPAGTDPSKLTFLDGTKGASYPLKPRLDLAATFAKLQDAIKAAASMPATNTTSTPARAVFERGLDRFQDPGHFTGTYAMAPCIWCKAGVTAAGVIAGAGCAFACVASFGLGCAACIAGAAAGVIAGMEACEKSNACCPIRCGDGFPGQCCDGSEVCLDGNGHCCSKDQFACVGTACCHKDQSCISTGVEKGTCCPNQAVCGNHCCPNDTDTCMPDMTCCSAAGKCGSSCCDPGKDDIFEMVCVNEKKSLCCIRGQVEVNGICCEKGAFNCNGQCCSGTCDDKGQCHGEPQSPETCAKLGSVPCVSDKDCDNNHFCLAGCCAKIPT